LLLIARSSSSEEAIFAASLFDTDMARSPSLDYYRC
jgi:hypothetical protein